MTAMEIHRSEDRGRGEHGWLHARHSFNFSEFYHPKRKGFGLLRVLNEDVVEPGQGFATHAHDNMEIVTIVLEGALEHKDSEGNHGIIRPGDIQRMSAGTGIRHSEFNHSKTEKVHLLQIWVYPHEQNLKPGYEQKSFSNHASKNQLLTIVSGDPSGDSVRIHQDAYFVLGNFDAGRTVSYRLRNPGHGVYFFMIQGESFLHRETLRRGDAAGIKGRNDLDFRVVEPSHFLLIEVSLGA